MRLKSIIITVYHGLKYPGYVAIFGGLNLVSGVYYIRDIGWVLYIGGYRIIKYPEYLTYIIPRYFKIY